MAIKTVLVDDLDGTDATQTVAFTYEGKSYEIDLSESNAKALDDALARFILHAHEINRAGKRKTPGTVALPVDSKTIRQWAKTQGIGVNPHGRIPAEVVEAFTAAQAHHTTDPRNQSTAA